MSNDDAGDLDRAHRAVKELAKTLEADGVDPENIVDALLVVGTNAAKRLWGAEPLISYFRKVETAITTDQPIGKAH